MLGSAGRQMCMSTDEVRLAGRKGQGLITALKLGHAGHDLPSRELGAGSAAPWA